MAVTYNTLFARLGRLFDFAKAIRTSQATIRTEYEDTMSNYSDADRDQVKRLTRSVENRIDQAGGIVGDLQSDAVTTLVELMDDDTTVYKFDVQSAVRELIRQMIAESTDETIDRPSSGYVTLPTNNKGTAAGPGGSNTGNGIFLLSDMMPQQGFASSDSVLFLDWPSIRSETIRATCMKDSTQTNVSEAEETWSIQGMRAVPNLDEDWPKGSGTNATIRTVSPDKNGGRSPGANVCTNSNFEQFTSNVPNNFTRVAGTAGTHIYAAGSGYRGSNALRFVGDGSTNPNLTQTLRTTAGTLGQINPDRPYTITVAAKYATARPTGNLVISVRNSSGTILNNGVINREMSLTVLSSAITTSYALYSAVVFSPQEIPKGCVIDVRFSANVANTSEVFIDDLIIAEMRQPMKGGLAYQMIGGSTNYAQGDQYTAAITNNISAGDGEMALEFERFFQIGTRFGLALPSATSPTQADSLIS